MLDTILTYNMNPASAYKYFGGNESDEDIGDIEVEETYSNELNGLMEGNAEMEDLFSGAADELSKPGKMDVVLMPDMMEDLFSGAADNDNSDNADNNYDSKENILFVEEFDVPIKGMAEMYYENVAKIYEELAREASKIADKEVPKKFIKKIQKHKKHFYKYLNK